MNRQSQHLKLAPTAAMVMQMGGKIFQSHAISAEYLKYIDLSSADDYINHLKNLNVWELVEEAVCNRKFTIKQAILDEINRSSALRQVVLLAAGKSPLGLELAYECENKLDQIFEVDISENGDKEEIYKSIDPKHSKKINIVQCDITDETIIQILADKGYKKNYPCLVVLEGISHYLEPSELEETLNNFRNIDQTNIALVEYCPPIKSLHQAVREQTKIIFELMEKTFFPKGMYKYTQQDLKIIFQNLAGQIHEYYSMDKM